MRRWTLKKTAKKDKPSSEKQPIPSEKVDTGDDLVVLDESEEKTRFHDTAFVGVLKMVIYIVVVLTVSLYIAYGIILAGNDIFAFSKGERAERKVTLPEGLSVGGLGKGGSLWAIYAAQSGGQRDGGRWHFTRDYAI